MAQSEKPTNSSQAQGQGPSSPSGPKDLIIAEIGTEKSFSKGSIIVRQGDSPESFYVVRKGQG